MKKTIVPGVFLLLLISCQPVFPGFNGNHADLEKMISEAAAGSPEKLMELGRTGGDGAWFALSVMAADAGYPELARKLRIRSAEEDGAPFGPRSLAEILIEDPEALKRPLTRLKQAEKKYGSSTVLRHARIAVLQSLGNERLLISELENFSGEPWEAPLLVAGLSRDSADPVLVARIERFILHCSDPDALEILDGKLPEGLSEAYRHLFQARLNYSRGLFLQALDDYRFWLREVVQNTGDCTLESPPPVFKEMSLSAGKAGLTISWAGILGASALDLSGPVCYAAAFSAGELFRQIGDRPAALKAFTLAADTVPRGLERDRALWSILGIHLRDRTLTASEEVSAFTVVFGSWYKPERFSDYLREFLHRRVSRGEWSLLEQMYLEWGVRWPDDIRSEAAWILAFAVREGRLSGSAEKYLETALNSSPLSWPGLRAAGILNIDLEPAIPLSPADDTGAELTDDDKTALLFLEWGLSNKSAQKVLAKPDLYSNYTIRRVAAALAAGEPRISIRVTGLLYGKPGYIPNREDLLLRYPLPLGPLAGDIAVENNLPPEIFLGLIRTESAWDRNAISRSGAQGLAQFMPATWDEWVGRLKLSGNPDPFEPETNLRMAAAYLNWLLLREWTFGWTDVLASYNAGGGWLRTWRKDFPGLGDDLFSRSLPIEEPRSYISKVLSAATIYGYLYAGERPHALHTEWGLEMFEVNQ